MAAKELFSSLNAEAGRARPALAHAVRRTYFTERFAAGPQARGPQWAARSVLVDTEPRVVQRLVDEWGAPGVEGGTSGSASDWCYRQESTCWRQGGAANNWAYGFLHHGPRIGDEVLEKVGREVERCDRLEGFLALHSVAGGTGSGLGSYTMQLLRDAFPAAAITAVSVWPFESGEVSVQSFNATLSLAALYEYTDMAILCENERYLDMCRRALNDPNPSFASLNKAICESLIRVALPSRAGAGPGGMASPVVALGGQLCAHPLYRLVTARSMPQVSQQARAFSTDSWQGMQRRMVQMCEVGSLADRLPSREPAPSGGSGQGENSGSVVAASSRPSTARADVSTTPAPTVPCRSVASAAFLWGDGAVEAPLEGLRKLPTWRLALDPFQAHADPHQVDGLERSLGLLSNCRTVVPPLAAASEKASAMLKASAYVHQYERCGLSREGLSEALLQLMQVKSDYERL